MKGKVDFTQGPITSQILVFSIPIFSIMSDASARMPRSVAMCGYMNGPELVYKRFLFLRRKAVPSEPYFSQRKMFSQ